MKTGIWTLVGLMVLVLTYLVVQASRSDYLEFARQRTIWHQKCDAYVGAQHTTPVAAECERELQALLRRAKQKGW